MAKPKMTEDIIKNSRRDLSEQGHFKELRNGLDNGIIVSSDHSTIVSSDHGTIISENKKIKTTSLRISEEIYNKIRKYCFEKKISINSFFVKAIERDIKRIINY